MKKEIRVNGQIVDICESGRASICGQFGETIELAPQLGSDNRISVIIHDRLGDIASMVTTSAALRAALELMEEHEYRSGKTFEQIRAGCRHFCGDCRCGIESDMLEDGQVLPPCSAKDIASLDKCTSYRRNA